MQRHLIRGHSPREARGVGGEEEEGGGEVTLHTTSPTCTDNNNRCVALYMYVINLLECGLRPSLPPSLLLAPQPREVQRNRRSTSRGSFAGNKSKQPQLHSRGAQNRAKRSSQSDYSKAEFMKPPDSGM